MSAPCIYIPHGTCCQHLRLIPTLAQQTLLPPLHCKGGGPLPILGQPPALATWLRNGAPKILGIDRLTTAVTAILIITAHWETSLPTLSAGLGHDLYFDYSGFPAETYNYTYPAPGSPSVAQRAANLLADNGFFTRLDVTRGWDHGVFVPMLLMHPKARIPIVQMSILTSLDAASHIRIGRALAPLRDEGVAIVGSGMSFHNMGASFGDGGPRVKPKALAFEKTLSETCTHLAGEEREKKLEGWVGWEGAKESHPRPEHLVPLFVIAGAAGADIGHCVFNGEFHGFPVSAFAFMSTEGEELAGKRKVPKEEF
ncbi:Extradiol aromatic ring-opening dioxygenase [Gonapodya prolifera JEL478]|uniref:Extradiol aromatic ring-opening dioxygenase n=1 Tax=Gonapodya prolifera (strain JEL478) TaxID=1344416 RepID=A0A139A371_GONPJ|nr:Extradiol aromatic ring-opening dioxygenase [Gonapodya prolifera JEL478]|eukprot:KXS11242.1 Extradiol aromatic ring-opening dioxygenase [Gonapodya prolifera JEL478]